MARHVDFLFGIMVPSMTAVQPTILRMIGMYRTKIWFENNDDELDLVQLILLDF